MKGVIATLALLLLAVTYDTPGCVTDGKGIHWTYDGVRHVFSWGEGDK